MDSLRERREAVVREHILRGDARGVPDQRNELIGLTTTIQRQLGIAHDPMTLKGRLATVLNHPVTIAGAFLRRARQN